MSKVKEILDPIKEWNEATPVDVVEEVPIEAPNDAKTRAVPPDFIEICESIQKTLLDTACMIQNTVERIQFYVEEAKKG